MWPLQDKRFCGGFQRIFKIFIFKEIFMKKPISFSLAALLAAALWFAGCEQDITGNGTSGDTPDIALSVGSLEKSIIRTEEQAGVPPNQWAQITDATFTTTFGKSSIWAVDCGPILSYVDTITAFVAGGDGGAAAYSFDGVTWTAIPNVTNGETINGIADNGKGTFVMVANNSTLAYTSDIISGQWTTLTGSATQMTNTIYAVACGERTGRFVIGGYNGEAAYSDDNGATWTAIKDLFPIFSPNSNIRAISTFFNVSAGGDTFLVVGGRSGPYPMYNEAAYSLQNGDNGSWVSKPNKVYCRGLTIGYVAGGTPYFVASGYDMNGAGSNNITYVSAQNIASAPWTPVSVSTTGVSGWFDTVAYGGGYFIAGGVGGQISYTQDLSNWTAFAPGMFTGYVDSIAYGDITLPGGKGRFVAVGDNGIGAYTTNPIVLPLKDE
jgi:hypothetical protein